LSGFFRGSLAAVAVNASENAVLFLAYERALHFFKPQKTVHYAYCGSLAAFFAAIVQCPAELVKCRMQAYQNTNNPHRLPAILRQISKERHGFFQGMTSLWLRVIPGYFFFFYGKEFYLSIDFMERNLANNDALRATFSGTFAGLFFWITMLPVDNVKTRIQVSGSAQSFRSLFMETLKKSPKSFYSGFTVTVIRAIFANIPLFYTYERCKLILPSLI